MSPESNQLQNNIHRFVNGTPSGLHSYGRVGFLFLSTEHSLGRVCVDHTQYSPFHIIDVSVSFPSFSVLFKSVQIVLQLTYFAIIKVDMGLVTKEAVLYA